MTIRESPPAPEVSRSSGSAAVRGGDLLLAAGVLQLLGATRVVVPAVPEWFTPGWQLLCWLLGGLTLLAASILLAVGRRGGVGIVGRTRWGRAALIVSGTGDLLLVLVTLVALAGGAAMATWTTVGLGVAQLLIAAATVAAVAAILRARVLTGVARWMFVLVAAVDLVTLGLALGSATEAALVTALVVRPLVVTVTGAVLVLQSRLAVERSRPTERTA